MKFINNKKNLCQDDLLQCIYNLNRLDLKIFKELKKQKETRVNKLAKNIGKERSTVYRSLQKLNRCGLCNKKTKKIKTGGYYHTYQKGNIEKTKKEIEKQIDNWYKKMKKTVKKL